MNKLPITVVCSGQPSPIGATWDGEGVNFALFSANAEKVELCVFDSSGNHELQRLELKARTNDIWHGYLPQARPGMLYGYRVHGRYRPQDGHRFNANKLLVDPYARSLAGEIEWSDAHFGYRIGHEHEDLSFDRHDSARGMPKCRVIDPAYNWQDDRPPRIAWQDTVIYELHVKGFTMGHPGVPPELRGTYAGLASAPAIEHFKRLGVTAVELLPVHAFAHDRHLVEKGLCNFWGYNSLAFLSPDLRYAATGRISEFKTMVKTLHAAGIEVILDVVYNHTAEGNQMGPTLSLRGIDNASYYRLVPGNARYYMDYTGCGNTLDTANPRVLDLVRDSLRYWVEDMHVDGFRFDLAVALTRGMTGVEMGSAFLEEITRDPVLSQVKLIAEPWDLGLGGYQLGGFPQGWSEWNDRYRDTLRAFGKADAETLGEFATRFTGSSDRYERNGRTPQASINFITAHDGFTLHDLVSYNHKHNEANLEGNRDGTDNNLSWNCGVEGSTDDDAINTLRRRQKRNFLTLLLLSQGVPMLLAGDEMGRSQGGNNNAYCQDNEISWVDWSFGREERQLFGFVRRLIRLRRARPILRRGEFFQGRPVADGGVKEIMWFRPDGREMDEQAWSQSHARCIGIFLAAEPWAATTRGKRHAHANTFRGWLSSLLRGLFKAGTGTENHTDAHVSLLHRLLGRIRSPELAAGNGSFLILVNAHHDTIPFLIPRLDELLLWSTLIDTYFEDGRKSNGRLQPGESYALHGRSIAVLQAVSKRRTLLSIFAKSGRTSSGQFPNP
ncbi:MAG: glycogen debranching protein GlgX [Propionivibrio sp.]|uniref:glycogen debranching protein GlgX n=1 Tax=Propionivibrio sp. TaxID=2212460 RepID=UPI001A370DDC|nr:glycogen debranching protein GlgX [Propionivibrio sp.]MBL8414634.1 glycogen debranching protein GlgX [Propionivibrio sp.]